ncbi:MAG TPA: hypothetical protein VIV55_06700 [Flavobacterium sp.]
MKPLKARIEEIKSNGYELDFGTVFEHAFENYKKIAVYAGSMLLISFFLFIILLTAIAIAVFGVGPVTEFLKPENLKPETFTGNFLLIYTASIIFLNCLISPFQAGFLKMADCGEKGEEFHVSTIFEYYKSPYFGNIFISTLIITLMSSGLSTIMKLVGIESLGLLTSFTISLVTLLTIPLIVFGKLNATEAIQSSIIIVLKQPFLILGLLIIAILGSLVGFMGFCIGIFFTLPFVYSMEYAIYNSIIGTDSDDKIEN